MSKKKQTKELLEEMQTAFVEECESLRKQVIFLNGQIEYNKKVQKAIQAQIHQLELDD